LLPPQSADLTRDTLDGVSDACFELPPRKSDPSLHGSDNSDPFSGLLSNLSIGDFSPAANRVPRGGQAAVGSARMRAAAPDPSPQAAQEVDDPSYMQGVTDDGTFFWFKPDDPSHPTFTQPMLSPEEACLMFASFQPVRLPGSRFVC
jgi:hypothetical protein